MAHHAFWADKWPQYFLTTCHENTKGVFHYFASVYLDNIIIYSKTPEEHLDNLQRVFTKQAENKLFAKLLNCVFYQSEVEVLGHIVSKDGVHTDPRKIQAMVNWPTPETLKEPSWIPQTLPFVLQIHLELCQNCQTLVEPSPRTG